VNSNFAQPISWSWGTAKPTKNEFSWTNLSSVLWVEQPVGTGYSQGTPNIRVRARYIFVELCVEIEDTIYDRTRMT
jgi:hypothetical protein